MEEFWKFMEEKRYAFKGDGFKWQINCSDDTGIQRFVNPNRQMLIGFMIEYLVSKGRIESTIVRVQKGILNNNIYEELENQIKEGVNYE